MYANIHEVPQVVRKAIRYCTLHKVDWTKGDEYNGSGDDRVVVSTLDEANVVSSGSGGFLLLDIDLDAALLKSSTPKHHHLYVELPAYVTKDQYNRFLKAASEIGLIQDGYAEASIARGYTSLRLPWVRKDS